jgi:hypothetical protein
MSDQINVLFDRLRGAQPPAPFAPASAIRRRGRERRHRRALAAGTAAFTVAGLAVGVPWIMDLDQDGRPPASVTPTTTAPGRSPTSAAPSIGPGVPETLMLRPAEVGPGVRVEEIDDLGPNGPDWRWGEIMRGCRAYRAADYPAQRTRTDARVLAYARGGGAAAIELVERFPADRSRAAFDEVLSLLGRCPGLSTTEREVTFTIIGTDVAGDDSVLVRADTTFIGAVPPDPERRTDFYLAVRVGEFIATLDVYAATESQARDLGRAAAARLG